jgi:bis(5'-nucleosidyl)-tetraphosphatase
MPDKPILTSCGFLIARNDTHVDLLLLEHAARLDLPKGHVDAHESRMQCALRELAEETGILESHIQIDPGFEFTTQYPVQADWLGPEKVLKELQIFLAWLVNPYQEILLTEHQGYRWVPWTAGMTLQKETLDPLLRTLDAYWGQHPLPPQARSGTNKHHE